MPVLVSRITLSLTLELEEYFSLLYGVKGKDVNEARYDIFDRKFSKDKKIADISLLPLCKQALALHILCANFITREWRAADVTVCDGGNIVDNGWNEIMEHKWVETVLPEDVRELLIENDYEDFSENSDLSDPED